jgi:SEC-C motif
MDRRDNNGKAAHVAVYDGRRMHESAENLQDLRKNKRLMTLILAAGNLNHLTLVADRRFTYWDGSLHDEKNKITIFNCLDAKMVFAFTGLAEVRRFRTADWIWQTLSVAAAPDFLLLNTIARLAKLATDQWVAFKDVSGKNRRISIVAIGYTFAEGAPRFYYFNITNFERQDGIIEAEAQSEFWVNRFRQTKAFDSKAHFATVAGLRQALPENSLQGLADIAKKCVSPDALVNKSVALIQGISQLPNSAGLVGGQCSSVILPADPRGASLAGYHSAQCSNEIYLPQVVIARGQSGGMRIRGTHIEAFDDNGHPKPLIFPQVRPDYPCSCGSGKKYKECHGQK